MGKIIKVSDDIFDKQLEQLPREVTFCKKCVISNQRPSSTVEFKNTKGEIKKVINFDEKGMNPKTDLND